MKLNCSYIMLVQKHFNEVLQYKGVLTEPEVLKEMDLGIPKYTLTKGWTRDSYVYFFPEVNEVDNNIILNINAKDLRDPEIAY